MISIKKVDKDQVAHSYPLLKVHPETGSIALFTDSSNAIYIFGTAELIGQQIVAIDNSKYIPFEGALQLCNK
jgi:hypothetical protein